VTPTEALTRLLGEYPAAGARPTRLLRPLHLGPLAHSWLLEYGDEQAVLRIDQPAAKALGLDRAAEFARLAAIAAAGLGPPPIAVDAAQGLLLRRHVAGRAWQAADLGQAANLQRAAALLRQVHALPIAAPPLDLQAAIDRYARLAGPNAAAQAATCRALLAACQDPRAPQVFCHNDPVAGNFVTTPGALRLIDWEYSGFNEFWFDLAVVSGQHELPEPRVWGLLEAYLQRPPTAADCATLARWVAFYRALVSLWQGALPALPRNCSRL
jgi:aminoglycoside phosphotransferase (APT) family kinase protein